ncbi:hypothetical protein [Amycolatopsis solani]|uniref:hypothetical protein n=1 Tax=Amycolatopsis solani TaxID=3028615 RepID=UPI0025AF5EB1|nr:hypothetical protein [Amycolatopsis sp. MEP2-6]
MGGVSAALSSSSGYIAQPTSATAAAAIDVFRERGAIRPGETTVVVLTGSGLKAPGTLRELIG